MKNVMRALGVGGVVVAIASLAAVAPANAVVLAVGDDSGDCAASAMRQGSSSTVINGDCQYVQAAIKFLYSDGSYGTVKGSKVSSTSVATAQTSMPVDYWGTIWLSSSTSATTHF